MGNVDVNAQDNLPVGGDVTGRDKHVNAGDDAVGKGKLTAKPGGAAAGEGGIASVGDGNVNVVA